MLTMLEIISDPCQFLQGSEVEQTDVDWIMAKVHSHSRLYHPCAFQRYLMMSWLDLPRNKKKPVGFGLASRHVWTRQSIAVESALF